MDSLVLTFSMKQSRVQRIDKCEWIMHGLNYNARDYDEAAPHYTVIVREWLDERFLCRWISRRGPFNWPALSPDLTPCDCFLWGYLKDTVFKESCASVMQL